MSDTEPTLTILASDAAKAVAMLREVADNPRTRGGAFGPYGELYDLADLLTPGSWGADGTPYETVRRRISADIAAEQNLITAIAAVIERHHPTPDHVLEQTPAEEIARELAPVVRDVFGEVRL